MSEAARKVIKQLGDMYEQLHGGDDSDGYVRRSVFVDHCRQVVALRYSVPSPSNLLTTTKCAKASGPQVITLWTYARVYLSIIAHCVRLRE